MLASCKHMVEHRRMESLVTRFVTYPEDGLWVAHSLELDIIGVGDTPRAAVQELKSNIEAHLSFSKFKKVSPFREAPEIVQNIWKNASLKAVGMMPKAKKAAKKGTESCADVMKWSRDELSKLPKRKFDIQYA